MADSKQTISEEDRIPTNIITENMNEDEADDRIVCSNSSSLNKILEVAIKHVTELADSLNLVDESKSQFVGRFTEQFTEGMQVNLTVKGLPWVVSGDHLSSIQAAQQSTETEDAMLSRLGLEVEAVARRRKDVSADCCRIEDMRMKHERQNLKKLKIRPVTELPPSTSTLPSRTFPVKELFGVTQDLTELQMKLQKRNEKLSELQSNVDYVQDVVRRQNREALSDTGYQSE